MTLKELDPSAVEDVLPQDDEMKIPLVSREELTVHLLEIMKEQPDLDLLLELAENLLYRLEADELEDLAEDFNIFCEVVEE